MDWQQEADAGPRSNSLTHCCRSLAIHIIETNLVAVLLLGSLVELVVQARLLKGLIVAHAHPPARRATPSSAYRYAHPHKHRLTVTVA